VICLKQRQLAVRIEENKYLKLKSLLALEDRTVSDLIRQCVDQYIEIKEKKGIPSNQKRGS